MGHTNWMEMDLLLPHGVRVWAVWPLHGVSSHSLHKSVKMLITFSDGHTKSVIRIMKKGQ